MTKFFRKIRQKMNALLIVSLIVFGSCESSQRVYLETAASPTIESAETLLIEYAEFKPESIAKFELDGFDVDSAYKIDSLFIFAAYVEGDLNLSDEPTNWGDRLVVFCNNKIKFQSKPVGDVYLYGPHFYKNQVNSTVIIICQLGYEYYFGGEAFLIEKGKIQYLGLIEIESADSETSLTDIVTINEVADEIFFKFKSDSLNYKPGGQDLIIKNDNIHYTFKNGVFDLKGL
jgi:hypothetical protein